MTSGYYYKRISFNIIPRHLTENVDYLTTLNCRGECNAAVLSELHSVLTCFPTPRGVLPWSS